MNCWFRTRKMKCRSKSRKISQINLGTLHSTLNEINKSYNYIWRNLYCYILNLIVYKMKWLYNKHITFLGWLVNPDKYWGSQLRFAYLWGLWYTIHLLRHGLRITRPFIFWIDNLFLGLELTTKLSFGSWII